MPSLETRCVGLGLGMKLCLGQIVLYKLEAISPHHPMVGRCLVWNIGWAHPVGVGGKGLFSIRMVEDSVVTIFPGKLL